MSRLNPLKLALPISPLRYLLYLLLLVSFPISAGDIVFKNFSKEVVLKPQKEEWFLDAGSGITFKISPRLIVKTNLLDKMQLKKLDSSITDVKLLFKMSSASYYLLELVSVNELARVLEAMKNNSKIMLVQPDQLELNDKAEKSNKDLAAANKLYLTQLNIPALWKKTKGEGVKIAIIDDGFNLQHKDFQHANVIFSYDIHTQQLQAAPATKQDSHGTKVAGIIFAQLNDSPINGIAPNADLIAIRHVDTWTSSTLLTFYLAYLNKADVINASWTSRYLLQPVADVVHEIAVHGRQGKGAAVVFSAGNQGREILPFSTEASIMDAVVIGASDQNKQRKKFSNYGNTVDAYVYGDNVLSTDVSGGYGRFSGTSLSAAVVSGYLALLFANNPALTLDQAVHHLQKEAQ